MCTTRTGEPAIQDCTGHNKDVVDGDARRSVTGRYRYRKVLAGAAQQAVESTAGITYRRSITTYPESVLHLAYRARLAILLFSQSGT